MSDTFQRILLGETMATILTRKQQALQTKFRITQVAMDLFTTHGFEAVKITDICEKAGISVGAFYYHFTSKDMIVDSAYAEMDAYLQTSIESITYTSSLEKILSIFEEANTIMNDLGWRFVSDIYRHNLSADNPYSASTMRYPTLAIEEALENGKKSGEFHKEFAAAQISSSLMNLGRGITYDWCFHKNSYSLIENSKELVLIYLHHYCI